MNHYLKHIVSASYLISFCHGMESGGSVYMDGQVPSKEQPGTCDRDDFDNYFMSILDYTVSPPTQSFGMETYNFKLPEIPNPKSDSPKTLTQKMNDMTTRQTSDRELVTQKLINFCDIPNFIEKIDSKDLFIILDELFDKNLPYIAERIYNETKSRQESEFPPKYDLLLRIYKGEDLDLTGYYESEDFLKQAYRVANGAGNMPMVKKLYKISGAEKRYNQLKMENIDTYSPEVNYIHEPYWSYNLFQLQEYGHRIVEKLKPYFVEESSIKYTNKKLGNRQIFEVKSGKDKVLTRKVPFGYVLPNLYLKDKLKDSKKYGVARLFIVPKGKIIKFTFKMPYYASSSFRVKTDPGLNPLVILSESFDVFQEVFEEGETLSGIRDFESYGHRDFNAHQVFQDQDGKRYLIDTKEEKNFFVPFWDPTKPQFTGNDIKQQRIVKEAKSLNFDPRVGMINISVNFEQ